MSRIGLTISGQGVAREQVRNGVGKSTYDFLSKSGKFVESKFGTSKLSGPQREAAKRLNAAGNPLELHDWTYPKMSGIAGSGGSSGAASAPATEQQQ